jgi:hypothetical protein
MLMPRLRSDRRRRGIHRRRAGRGAPRRAARGQDRGRSGRAAVRCRAAGRRSGRPRTDRRVRPRSRAHCPRQWHSELRQLKITYVSARASGCRSTAFCTGGPVLPHPLTTADRKAATGTTFQSFDRSSIDPGARPTQCTAAYSQVIRGTLDLDRPQAADLQPQTANQRVVVIGVGVVIVVMVPVPRIAAFKP